LLLGLSRLDEALDEARQLIALDPQSGGSKRLLGAIYMAMSAYEKVWVIFSV
jgi:hypothetical protein